jgi:hypothetical protein
VLLPPAPPLTSQLIDVLYVGNPQPCAAGTAYLFSLVGPPVNTAWQWTPSLCSRGFGAASAPVQEWGTWVHTCGIFDAANGLIYPYVNGVPTPGTYTASFVSGFIGSSDAYLGGITNHGSAARQQVSVGISAFAMWSGVLSAAQVVSVFNGGAPTGVSLSLVLWLDFVTTTGSAQGTVLVDLSGHNRTLALRPMEIALVSTCNISALSQACGLLPPTWGAFTAFGSSCSGGVLPSGSACMASISCAPGYYPSSFTGLYSCSLGALTASVSASCAAGCALPPLPLGALLGTCPANATLAPGANCTLAVASGFTAAASGPQSLSVQCAPLLFNGSYGVAQCGGPGYGVVNTQTGASVSTVVSSGALSTAFTHCAWFNLQTSVPNSAFENLVLFGTPGACSGGTYNFALNTVSGTTSLNPSLCGVGYSGANSYAWSTNQWTFACGAARSPRLAALCCAAVMHCSECSLWDGCKPSSRLLCVVCLWCGVCASAQARWIRWVCRSTPTQAACTLRVRC